MMSIPYYFSYLFFFLAFVGEREREREVVLDGVIVIVSNGVCIAGFYCFWLSFIWLLALIWSQPRHPLGLAQAGVVVVGQSRGSVTHSPLIRSSYHWFHNCIHHQHHHHDPLISIPFHHQPMCYHHSKLVAVVISLSISSFSPFFLRYLSPRLSQVALLFSSIYVPFERSFGDSQPLDPKLLS